MVFKLLIAHNQSNIVLEWALNEYYTYALYLRI